ncbi:MAG: hypothetical protein ACR2PF_05185 [Rhizobiaceae bacterium]
MASYLPYLLEYEVRRIDEACCILEDDAANPACRGDEDIVDIDHEELEVGEVESRAEPAKVRTSLPF